MLILLPPSEGKSNRSRGRPADPASWFFPELAATRARVAEVLAQVSASPDAPALLGVSPGLLDDIARNLSLTDAPATPAAEVYTGVLYDALDVGNLDAAARRRATRWVVIVSALYGAVRLTDRITAYRLAMTVSLGELGPLAALWRPELSAVLPPLAGRGVIVDCRSAPYAAAWTPSAELADRWAQVTVPGASHWAKHTRGLVARAICEHNLAVTSVPRLAEALSPWFTARARPPARPGRAWTLEVSAR